MPPRSPCRQRADVAGDDADDAEDADNFKARSQPPEIADPARRYRAHPSKPFRLLEAAAAPHHPAAGGRSTNCRQSLAIAARAVDVIQPDQAARIVMVRDPMRARQQGA
jgi:hypothetical protein